MNTEIIFSEIDHIRQRIRDINQEREYLEKKMEKEIKETLKHVNKTMFPDIPDFITLFAEQLYDGKIQELEWSDSDFSGTDCYYSPTPSFLKSVISFLEVQLEGNSDLCLERNDNFRKSVKVEGNGWYAAFTQRAMREEEDVIVISVLPKNDQCLIECAALYMVEDQMSSHDNMIRTQLTNLIEQNYDKAS